MWWSVAGFSVLRQTAQRIHCLYTLMGPAVRNADVSKEQVAGDIFTTKPNLQKYLSRCTNKLRSYIVLTWLLIYVSAKQYKTMMKMI